GFHDSKLNYDSALQLCSGARRLSSAVRGAVFFHLATHYHLRLGMGAYVRRLGTGRLPDTRSHSVGRAYKRNWGSAGYHLVLGLYGRLYCIAHVPVFCVAKLYPTCILARLLPYVCGCFGGLCPSCHVGLLGRNGNQRVWSTHVRIRCAKLSGIWRHVWSWVDSHRRGVILHVLRV